MDYHATFSAIVCVLNLKMPTASKKGQSGNMTSTTCSHNKQHNRQQQQQQWRTIDILQRNSCLILFTKFTMNEAKRRWNNNKKVTKQRKKKKTKRNGSHEDEDVNLIKNK